MLRGEIPADAPRDSGGGGLDRIPCQVRISGGRLHLRVTKQLPDHREALAQRKRPGSIRMPEVVNSHVLQVSTRADAAPGLLQIGDVGARQPAADDPGIAFLAGQVCQHGTGLGAEGDDPSSSLGVRQLDAIVLDVFPAQELDLRKSAACQQQQAEGGDGRRHFILGLAQDLAQTLGLLGRQEPLALALLVALDVAAGIGPVRPQAPDLGEGEHLGEHAERPVRLVGLVAHVEMQFGDVLTLHLGDPHLADRGVDEERHRPTVLPLGAGLAVGGDILFEEPPAELGHDRFGLALCIGIARIDTLLRQRQDLQRRGPGLVNGDAAVLADGEPAQLAADAGLEDVVLPARLPDANAEAGQLAVPVDGIGAVGLEGLDGALGEFGDAVCHGSNVLDAGRAF